MSRVTLMYAVAAAFGPAENYPAASCVSSVHPGALRLAALTLDEALLLTNALSQF